MACTSPQKWFWSRHLNENGNRQLTRLTQKALDGAPIFLPCQSCLSCRLERARQWSIRCQAEASLYPDNCFLTLTYSNVEMPDGGSLNRRHVQLFLKTLRKIVSPRRFRFFGCGEYGEESFRPHYHLCLFNLDFHDKKKWKTTSTGHVLYRSASLERVWYHGDSYIGSLTMQSAGYCARYSLKKITGKKADEHYRRSTPDGRDYWLTPEFAMYSNRPGIGQPWLDRYSLDVYPHDYIVVDGRKMRPPKFFDRKFEQSDPTLFLQIKDARQPQSQDDVYALQSEMQPHRLAAREEVVASRLTTFTSRSF